MTAAPPTDREVMSVSALVARLRGTVEAKFAAVWVAGEVVSFTKAASGHMYFTLKDEAANLRAVLFRGVNLRMKFEPRNGMEVLARGRLSVFDQRGDVQLQIEELQPKGVGAAELALRQLKEKLLARGYFDPRRKKPLPKYPKRVALIASATGAAIRDMLELLAQRWPRADVIVRPSRVQGTGAAEEVAVALRELNRLHASGKLPLCAVVIGRGGGSSEDLAAFNEEAVADAVFQSVVPVVSAIGHETDVTVADLVADHRAETPTAAIVALTPHRLELLADVDDRAARLGEAMARRLEVARDRLDAVASRPAFRRPLQRVNDLEQRLDDTAARLHRAARARVTGAAEKLAAAAAQLDGLSPLNILKRGYSLTRTTAGTVVTDPAAVRPGDILLTRVAGGEIRSVAVEAAVHGTPNPTGADDSE
ncbi:exodeoxyribonuclease VII large subunit [Urbifossiella limnaea]|uniref:Exodeoxyribonuclease 7 large subunit n=1 Tax=Urbifossiella limnaea TaxID=2528023 RepID=A0A517XXL6_9BACT|nr:exodeoxyribonuclease VII large subunit [Urbifossiella limnaea]QDU22256.1 Exodeoxyribonuclease 7 large subunit [Urbifossiella limnaea]